MEIGVYTFGGKCREIQVGFIRYPPSLALRGPGGNQGTEPKFILTNATFFNYKISYLYDICR